MSNDLAPSAYGDLVQGLAHVYDGVFPGDVIERVVREARDMLEPRANIPQFLPVHVANQAREHLSIDVVRDIRDDIQARVTALLRLILD